MTDNALKPRGQELYDHLAPEGTDTARKNLALEAARMADRLEDLDKVIHGKGFQDLFQLDVVDDYRKAEGVANVEVVVKINSVISESRQLAAAFSGILKTLGAEGEAQAKPQPQTGTDVIAQKRKEREARRKAAQ